MIRIAAVAAGTAVLLVASPAPSDATVPDGFFGVSAQELMGMSKQGRTAELDAHLAAIAATELDFIRAEASWRDVEPYPPQDGVHTYRWGAMDSFAVALARRDLAMLPSVTTSPGWAQTDAALSAGCGRRAGVAAEHAGDYGAFAAAFVERYGPRGSFWSQHAELPAQPVTRIELWNEPNWIGFWCPTLDTGAYAAIAAAAARAVHASDPRVGVSIGGLAAPRSNVLSSDGTIRGMGAGIFLRSIVALEPALPELIDAAAIHPYARDPAESLLTLDWFRSEIEAAGFDPATPIWVTEFGWARQGVASPLSESERAAAYTELTGSLARSDCGLEAVAAHTWTGPESDPLRPDHWYGIAAPLTGELYPSGQAYVEQVALFEGSGSTPPPAETLNVCGQPSSSAPEPVAPPPAEPAASPAGETPEAQATSGAIELVRKAPRRVRGRRVTVRYRAPAGVPVEFRIDRRRWRKASSPLRVRGLDAGRHVLVLRATPSSSASVEPLRLRFAVRR